MIDSIGSFDEEIDDESNFKLEIQNHLKTQTKN
jgi:hypothetical protein